MGRKKPPTEPKPRIESAEPEIVAYCHVCDFPLMKVDKGLVDHFLGWTKEEKALSVQAITICHRYYMRRQFDRLADQPIDKLVGDSVR